MIEEATMTSIKRLWMIVLIAAVTMAVALCAVSAKSEPAQQAGVLLSGSVKSDTGAKLDGVTVSARSVGQTITTSVFTDEGGNYYFPRMAEGKYRVWAQAEGFEAGKSEVSLNGTAGRQDFTLNTIKDNLEIVKQMTGQEYVTSLPEDTPEHRKMKDVFYNTCTGCHEPNYILQNRFDEIRVGSDFESNVTRVQRRRRVRRA
jgi:hypothetical protein